MSENTLPDAGSVHAHVGMICFKTGPPHHVVEGVRRKMSVRVGGRGQEPFELDADVVRRTGL